MKAYKLKYNYGLTLLTVILFLTSCDKHAQLSPSDYVSWVSNEDNGLVKTKTIDEIQVKVQYKPISYVIANEMRTNDIKKTDFDKRYEELSSMQYYNLTLDITDARNIMNYKVSNPDHQQERIHYLSFGMQQDIRLEENGEELPCIAYHFERTYDVSKERTFLVGFKQNAKTTNATKTFVLDSPIIGVGPIKIQFKKEDIERLPKMKLK